MLEVGGDPCVQLAFSVADVDVPHRALQRNEAQSGWIEPLVLAPRAGLEFRSKRN